MNGSALELTSQGRDVYFAGRLLNQKGDQVVTQYAGVSAACMFRSGGSEDWGNIARGCLACMHRYATDYAAESAEAHEFCYAEARRRTSEKENEAGLRRAVLGAVMWVVAALPHPFPLP